MKETKRLLSINLVLVMLFMSSFGGFGFSASASSPVQKLIVDGVQYDASKDQAGEGWSYRFYGLDTHAFLTLNSYNGGAIESDIDLVFSFSGENMILGNDSSAIRVNGNAWFLNGGNGDRFGRLTLTGGTGYSAVKTTGTLTINGCVSALGSANAALEVGELSILPDWMPTVYVGTTADTAVTGNYVGQNYFRVELTPFTALFDGNGGKTVDDKPTYRAVFTAGTPGYLNLYGYRNLFTLEGNTLVGWMNGEEETNNFNPNNSYFRYPSGVAGMGFRAVWENDTIKRVTLKQYSDGRTTTLNDYTVTCDVGSSFQLPKSYLPGYRFDGWLAGDSTIVYPSGTTVSVNANMSFTAQYTKLYFTVGVTEYDASVEHSNAEEGWDYSPSSYIRYIQENGEYKTIHDGSTFHIHENYTGGSIDTPTNAQIFIMGSFASNDGKPAITGDGDIELRCVNENMTLLDYLTITGGTGSSAVVAEGSVFVYVQNSFDGRFFLHLISGTAGTPAIDAEKDIIIYSSPCYVGTDAQNLVKARTYNRESYLAVSQEDNVKYTISGQTVVPDFPNEDGVGYMGWTTENGMVWYRPGDAIDAGESTRLSLQSYYPSDCYKTILIDGHGGKTQSGSKYIAWLATASDLKLYHLPDNRFYRSGYRFTGYNTSADGTGVSLNPNDTIPEAEYGDTVQIYTMWQNNTLLGDANGDGVVTAYDTVMILRIVAGLDTPSTAQQTAGNVNGDGGITAFDAVLILRHVAGLSSGFAIGQPIT